MTPRFGSGQFFGAHAVQQTAGGFQAGLWRATRPPDAVVPHEHDDAHFVFVLDDGYHSLARQPGRPDDLPFDAGALIWNPPGVEHRDSFATPGGRFLSVSFSPPQQARRGDPLLVGSPAAQSAARRLVGRLATFRAGDALALEGLLLQLASVVLDPDELDEDPAPDWVMRASFAIEDLATRPGLEVRDIARLLGVHPVSLARRYRRHFGRSPAAAIRLARADRAAAGVRRSADLAELAHQTGYADQSHLTREFRAIFGLAPGAYRARFG